MHRRTRTVAVTLALLAATGTAAIHAEPHPKSASAALKVTVTGLHSQKGRLVACLWHDKQGFPSCEKSGSAERLVLPVSGATMEFAFPHVAPGEYAVTVHHDEDGNGKMKHNFIGMPVEGVGVSNNPGGMPGYSKSLIPVDGPGAITVKMRYLFG